MNLAHRVLPWNLRVACVAAALCVGTAAFARPPAQEVEPEPAWRSEDGKRSVWRDLARWYVDNDRPAEALDMVARLNAVGESTPEIRLIQGEALLQQGLPEEARPVLEAVAHDLPRDARPLRHLGVLYADIGEIDLALTAFAAAVKLDDGDAATQNNLGFLLLSGGRCAEALPHLERAVQVDPSTTRYRNNLAFALVCEGEAQRALQLFRSTGTEAQARYNMGVAYERVDKIPSAILQYQAALAADPEHAGATEALTRLSSPTTEESP